MKEKNLRFCEALCRRELRGKDQAWVLPAPDIHRLGLFWRAGTFPRTIALHRWLATAAQSQSP